MELSFQPPKDIFFNINRASARRLPRGVMLLPKAMKTRSKDSTSANIDFFMYI